jgi:hypothetical protein
MRGCPAGISCGRLVSCSRPLRCRPRRYSGRRPGTCLSVCAVTAGWRVGSGWTRTRPWSFSPGRPSSVKESSPPWLRLRRKNSTSALRRSGSSFLPTRRAGRMNSTRSVANRSSKAEAPSVRQVPKLAVSFLPRRHAGLASARKIFGPRTARSCRWTGGARLFGRSQEQAPTC